MAVHRDWRALRCENGHEHPGYLGETGPGFQEWRPHAECPDCGCALFSRDQIEELDPFNGDELDEP